MDGALKPPYPENLFGPGSPARVIGHRGAAAVAPENTLPSFARALEAGVDAIELDLHCTRCGQLIVIHDHTLDRTTDGTGNVEDLNLEEPVIVTASRRPSASLAAKIAPWLVAAAATILAIVAWFGTSPPKAPWTSPVVRFTEDPPAPLDLGFLGHSGAAVALSPNGETMVWVGSAGRDTQLFMRHLDEDNARPIEGTEGAVAPFFSPNGEWIAFSVGDEGLRKVAIEGGAPQTICEIRHPHGVSWSDGVKDPLSRSRGPVTSGIGLLKLTPPASWLMMSPVWAIGIGVFTDRKSASGPSSEMPILNWKPAMPANWKPASMAP